MGIIKECGRIYLNASYNQTLNNHNMKKIFTLLVVCFTIFSLKTNAQVLSCNAGFTSQYLTGSLIKFIPVTNDSPLVQHHWIFGDGTTASPVVSPTHQYATNGVFVVKHYTVRHNPNNIIVCTDSVMHTITIAQAVCNLNASFFSTSTAVNPLTKQYYNTSLNFSPGDSIRWNFGDSTVSYAVNPTHTFANYGVYNVCLRVKKANNNGASTPPCVSETCHADTVIVPCNVQAYFTTNTTSGTAPATIQFTNQSLGLAPTDSITWTFGDGTSSHSLNPAYVYSNPGIYTVCLRIKKNSTVAGTPPCISTYCKTITITATCNLVSNFTFYRDSLPTIANNTYHFTNTSAPLNANDSIRWTFGDGTSSNQANPIHAYSLPGTYNVCLRVIKRTASGLLTNCVSEKCRVVIVPTLPNPCNLQVYFSHSISANLVTFTNQSVGYASGDSITWTFGDGTTSHNVNPNHTYNIAGTYTVCLTIKKNSIAGTTACIRQYCKAITVATACTLVANFTWYRDSTPTIANNLYHFTNISAPLNANDSIRWTFGNGTSSNLINPAHIYAQPGTYTVCLRIIKRTPNGALTNCIAEVCRTIIVPQHCNVQATFTAVADSINRKKIYFTNTTPLPVSSAAILWSFGDGTTSTIWNAVHEYLQPGRYYVCLRVQYGTCVSNKCDSITVTANPPTCAQLSQYSFVRSVTNNNIVSFSPNVIDNTVQYTWTFGNGTGSQNATPTHQFAAIGNYTVCLTAFRNNGCATTTCKTVNVTSTINCNNITLGFSEVIDSLVPNRIRFVANSNTGITNQLWTIAKLPTTATSGTATINASNPTHVFLDSGNYRVCLKVTFAGGCVKEFCKIIHIAQTMPFTSSCTLQVYPNPTSTHASAVITLAQPLVLNGYIYNSTSMLVAQKQQQGFVGNNTMSIYVGGLPAGIYSFRLLYGNQVCTSTFVKM